MLTLEQETEFIELFRNSKLKPQMGMTPANLTKLREEANLRQSSLKEA